MAVGFTCPVAPLRRCVERVAKIVERRNTIPILANIHIEAEANGRLSITGTDLDIWAVATTTSQVAADVKPGSITVPASLFLDFLKSAKADITFAEEENGMVAVSSGRSRFRLHSLPAQDFPALASFEPKTRFTLTPKQLDRIPDCVSFAISTEETRYYLNGIFLHAVSNGDFGLQLAAVATDGHRLSRLYLLEIEIGEAMPGVIVPRKMVSLFGLLSGAVDEGDDITIEVREERIAFTTPDLRIVSKLIDGTYPNYARVIPSNNERRASVERAPLGEAVDRVSKISSERGRAIAFSFDGKEGIGLRCQSPDAGEARDSVPMEGDFEEIEIGFNGRYLLDILGTFKADTLQFALADPGSPTVITDPGDATRLVVLMPMRV